MVRHRTPAQRTHTATLLSLAVLGSMLLTLGLAQDADAQGKPLLVVPFDREQVEDTLYQRFMDQMKADISATGEYELLPAIEQGMTDLLFSVGCAEPEPTCLQQIGESFGAEMIIYGSIWRNGPVTLMTVDLFDVLAGTTVVDVPIERTFESEDESKIFNMLVGEVQQIFYPFTGEIIVGTSEEGAEVLFDGVPVGDTSAGPLTLSGRPLGEHVITARKDGVEKNESVILLKDQPQEITVDMTVEVPGSFAWSYVAFGVGGAALIGGVVFSVLTNSAQSDADGLADPAENPTIDVNEANAALSDGPSFANTQFILYGLGAAAVITGAVLFYFEDGTSSESAPDDGGAEPTAIIAPIITEDAVGAGAVITF